MRCLMGRVFYVLVARVSRTSQNTMIATFIWPASEQEPPNTPIQVDSSDLLVDKIMPTFHYTGEAPRNIDVHYSVQEIATSTASPRTSNNPTNTVVASVKGQGPHHSRRARYTATTTPKRTLVSSSSLAFLMKLFAPGSRPTWWKSEVFSPGMLT
jgi:hypothetical protein